MLQALFAFALAGLPLQPTGTAASGCAADEPIVAIAYSEGPMGPRDLLVAVWNDGRILRSLDEKSAVRGYASARLSSFVMDEVRATLLRMRFWNWERPKVDLDHRIQQTLACADGRRGVFVHKGIPSTVSGPGQLRSYLFGIRLPSPVRAAPPIPDEWTAWFRAEAAESAAVPR